MEEKKTSILAIYDILLKYSDEKHPLSANNLIDYLSSDYNIVVDRRTIYKNIAMLEDYGYDISTYQENKKGYYLRSRQFETSEVFLLANAIRASNYIDSSSSRQLISKILSSQNKYVQKQFEDAILIENNAKRENKEFFLNIEIISQAIANKQVISFDYMEYNLQKKLVKRRNEKYIYSPYYLVYLNEKTFLVAKSIKHQQMTHFRIDKMKNVQVEAGETYLKLSNNESPYEYVQNKIYMYGNELNVCIRAKKEIIGYIIDIFGKEIVICADGDDYFKAYVKASKQGMKYLALQYLDGMEVLQPKEIRDDIIKALNSGIDKYNNEKDN